ncbi:hypothetical protein [Nostoc sp.]|uniref:hypothetical protein n=1 Tax=Nostoc sp. TaxID=1180 RepID=UPI002FFC93C7
MQNPEFRIHQSFSRGLGPTTELLHHQIIDLVVVQKRRLFSVRLSAHAEVRFFGHNSF